MDQHHEIERLIVKHGEPYRDLIESSIKWLDEHEPTWSLTDRVDREGFIERLVDRARP